MRKSRQILILMVLLLALSVWAAPPCAAAEVIEIYQPMYTKFVRVNEAYEPGWPPLLKEARADAEVVYRIPKNTSIVLLALVKSADPGAPDDRYYHVAYRDPTKSGQEYSGYLNTRNVQAQSEPYPWSYAASGVDSIYAATKETPIYKIPWKQDKFIIGTMKMGEMFDVSKTGANQYDGTVPYSLWLNAGDRFIMRTDASVVAPFPEAEIDLKKALPEVIYVGTDHKVEGSFISNWPIENSLFTITRNDVEVKRTIAQGLSAGTHDLADITPSEYTADLPASNAPYYLNIEQTYRAPNWPYPEETGKLIDNMYFYVLKPIASVSFLHNKVTVRPGASFENPLEVLPEDATKKSNFKLLVDDASIVKVDQLYPPRFTALKEGTTVITALTLEDAHAEEASFTLTVSASAPAILRGDANADGVVDILDLVSIIEYIVDKTIPPSLENADANADGAIDILDLVAIIEILVGK